MGPYSLGLEAAAHAGLVARDEGRLNRSDTSCWDVGHFALEALPLHWLHLALALEFLSLALIESEVVVQLLEQEAVPKVERHLLGQAELLLARRSRF